MSRNLSTMKKLKDDVRERRITSGSGGLDRILRQDISLDEECYGVYGDPNDPLPSAEEHFKHSQVAHGLPVLQFSGLDRVAAIAALVRRMQCSKFFDASSSIPTPTGALRRTPIAPRLTP